MTMLLVHRERGITRGIAIKDEGGNTIIPSIADQIRVSIGRIRESPLLVVTSDDPTPAGSSLVKGVATNILRLDANDLDFANGTYSMFVDYYESDTGRWQNVDRQLLVLIGTEGEESSSSSSSLSSSSSSSSSVVGIVRAYAAEGDSIVASGGPVPPHTVGEPASHARLLAAEYASQPTFIVSAFPGTNMSDMEARFTTPPSGFPNWPVPRNFIIQQVALGNRVVMSFMCGNALIEESAKAAYLDYIALAKQCRDLGGMVVLCDTLHRNDPINSPGFETGVAVNALNALIASNLALWDEHCRFNDDTWSSLANANNPLYSPEGTHKTALWYSLSLPRFKQSHDNCWSSERPVVTHLPDFAGTPRNGERLTCQPGTSNALPPYLFQWFRSSSDGYDVPISGAASNEYLCQPLDVDRTLICNVRHIRAGISVYVQSNRSSVVTSNYGPELIPEGNFSSGTGSFVATSVTMQAIGGRLRLTATGLFHGRASRTFVTVAGGYYRLSVRFFLGVGSVPGRTFIQNGVGGTTIVQLEYTANGITNYVFQAVGDLTYIDFRFPSDSGPEPVGSTLEWDDVSIKEVI